MSQPNQPNQPQQAVIKLVETPEYRESYANSVQIRVNLWDFFIQFGKIHQQKPNEVTIKNFQGVYLSPQQAKALLLALKQNISQYEGAFGEIKIDPKAIGSGAIQ
jgi:flagellar protein FlaG